MKKKYFIIVGLVLIVLVSCVSVVLYNNRKTIFIYENYNDSLQGYVKKNPCTGCVSDDILTVSNKNTGGYAYSVRGNTDKILTKYTLNDYIMLSDDGYKYIYNYIKEKSYELPEDIQDLSDEVLSTSIIVGSEDYLAGLLVDLESNGNYSYYSLSVNEFTFVNESIDGVISYNVDLTKLLDDRYLIINVVDETEDTSYTLIYNILNCDIPGYTPIKLNFDFYGPYSELFSVIYEYQNSETEVID